jgi:hypothetical protein
MGEVFALAVQEPPPVAWRESHKGHARLLALADMHYTRQTPGSNQFCRPGKNLCLLTSDGMAGWVTWRPLPRIGRKDGLEAWECTFFRNEGPRLSSELVREATEHTWSAWGWPPRDGLITSIGVEATRRRRSKSKPAGVCFREAGWVEFDVRAARDVGAQVWLRAPHPVAEPLSAVVGT